MPNTRIATPLPARPRWPAAVRATNRSTPALEDAERHRLRQQSLKWLRADLARHTGAVTSGDPRLRQPAVTQLCHWLVDPDLAGVRDENSLAELPEDEQQSWRNLWLDVAKLLKESGGQWATGNRRIHAIRSARNE